jgi:hypothetical protein
MRPESDAPGNARPVPETGTSSTKPDYSEPSSSPVRKGITGGYYWFPAPGADGITWTVLTCLELGCGPDAGHDADLWPKVIDRLAATWGRDAQALKRRLGNHYRGLPRGRITGTKRKYQIFHGNDAPVSGWKEIVIDRCNLHGLKVKMSCEEEKRVLSDDVLALEEALGVSLGRPKV